MKKKNKVILWILLIVSIFLLVSSIIIPIVIFKLKWIWFWITFGLIGVGWLIYGLILLIQKLISSEVVVGKIDPKDALKFILEETKYDEENPDNLQIESAVIERHGIKGTEPTPILVARGTGTEKKQKMVFIINLNNHKKEISKMINPSEIQIERAINRIAENPETMIGEETTTGLDRFGRPITTTKRTIPSSQKERDEQEKKELEEKSAV